jgi:copper(I)-binding protein
MKIAVLIMILASLASCGSSTESRGLVLEEAWIRPLPPGMGMTAGFGKLTNPGQQAIELTAFGSPEFGDVSLHRTQLVDGVSTMREAPALSIPADGSVELAPGGYHLMLMMPVGPIEPGQTVTVEITSADGQVFSFQLPVERR